MLPRIAYREATLTNRRLAYEENTKVAAIFWEWRHKVMAGLFAIVVALFALSGWLYQQQPKWFAAIPLMVGGVLSFIAAGFDRRNASILSDCYKVGATMEEHLEVKGIFKELRDSWEDTDKNKTVLTYTSMLRWIYRGVGVTLILMSIATFAFTLSVQPPLSPFEKLIRCFH